MRTSRFRWSIRGIMIAIVPVAVLLALPRGAWVIAVALSIPCLAIIYATWLAFRAHRKASAWSFGILSANANIIYCVVGVVPISYLDVSLYMIWFFFVAPTLFILGAAWADISTRAAASPRRQPALVWSLVLILTALPLVTAVSHWPLRVAFNLSRPAMDRLADQAAAGKPVALPQQAGLYDIARLDFDPGSGNVALVIDTNPNGPTGFVRVGPGLRDQSNPPYRPILGTDTTIRLRGGWWYQVED